VHLLFLGYRKQQFAPCYVKKKNGELVNPRSKISETIQDGEELIVVLEGLIHVNVADQTGSQGAVRNPKLLLISSEISVQKEFRRKLFQIMYEDKILDIMRWSENGQNLVIHNLPDFMQAILPRYFGGQDLPTFVDTLRQCGFYDTTQGLEKRSFAHPLFNIGASDHLRYYA